MPEQPTEPGTTQTKSDGPDTEPDGQDDGQDDQEPPFYIYREVRDKHPVRAVCLRRDDDWCTGLSFSVNVPTTAYYKYDLSKLAGAGYAFNFDGGRTYAGLFGRALPADLAGRTAAAGHVSVYLNNSTSWDDWHTQESQLNPPGQVWSDYQVTPWSQTLYDLREMNP